MDTTLVKFLILCIMCANIVLTTSMAVKGVANEDSNTRQRRSPANNFSLFGLNLGKAVTAARNSFSSIGNVFSGSRGNTHQKNDHEPIETFGNVRNPNTLSPIGVPNKSGIPNTRAQDDFQKGDRYVYAQENKSERITTTIPDKKQNTNEITVPERNYEAPENTSENAGNGDIDQQLIDYIFQNSQFNSERITTSIPDKKQNTNEITVPERNYEAPENTSENAGNGDIDQQLIDYIFQNSQFNYDGAGTTVNNNIDFVTETGEYETTTDILDNRIQLPAAAVATLLG